MVRLKLATWNVNSIRQREKHVCRWLEKARPDILVLQEIKCEAAAFPALSFHGLGYTAEAVGQKLKALSRAQQVLCVTHLPQIAAFADQHFLIEKREQQGRTKTAVRLMDDAERTQEIARMLSGATLTETSVRHAEQMLKASR